MIVLGLIDSKPSTAAVLVDGKLVSAISEERLCRMKMAMGMPREAISLVMAEAGVEARDLDCVAVGQRMMRFYPAPMPWNGWFQDGTDPKKRFFDEVSSKMAPLVGRMPLAWSAHHRLKSMLSGSRKPALTRLLRQSYGISAPVHFYDHHMCHAASAYYTSGLERSLVITLDGGGDGKSGTVYLGEDGRLRPLASIDSFHSIGNLYSYVTALCGFRAEKHEGKITGLAALGEPEYADVLRGFVHYQDPGGIRYSEPMYFHSALRQLTARLPDPFDPASLAASMQLVLEEVGTKFVRYWVEQLGLGDVAVAGGVFSNVKFNQRVHEIEPVSNLYVHPAMDDSGLAAGAAFLASASENGASPKSLVRTLPDVYLGPEYNDSEIEAVLERADLPAMKVRGIQREIARKLAEGNVVARFAGRMEYGPRALGHRSILYKATDPSVNDWLNERLRRTEFMPFAPATMAEHAAGCYEGLEGAENAARFMTITFNCTNQMRRTAPGVVHVDGTARPQLVDRQTAPDFYRILHEYRKLTGLPSVINTSFNMHEEPIVCSPDDAIRSFLQGSIDYLAMGDYMLSHPMRNRSSGAYQHDHALDLMAD